MADHVEHACRFCGSYLCAEKCEPAKRWEETARKAVNIVAPLPPPKPAEGDVWRLVIDDMEVRREFGIRKYGQPLGIEDGRDPLVDAYQEALDLAVYLRKAIAQREARHG